MVQQVYNKLMNHTTSLSAVILLLLTCEANAGISNVDTELAYRHDDNLSRAEDRRDRFSDNAVDLGVKYSWSQPLTSNSGLRLSGSMRLSEQIHYDDLSHLSFAADLRYRVQPFAGYTMPWIELGTSYERQFYRDSDIRDGHAWDASVFVGKRFTDRIGGRVGASREWRNAEQGKVFDWCRTQLMVAMDYKLSLNSIIYANLSKNYGDQVFTATPAPAFRIVAKAIADDPSFGLRRAYRLDSIANTFEIGMNITLNSANALDFGFKRFDTAADGGHNYTDNELQFSWLFRFQ